MIATTFLVQTTQNSNLLSLMLGSILFCFTKEKHDYENRRKLFGRGRTSLTRTGSLIRSKSIFPNKDR